MVSTALEHLKNSGLPKPKESGCHLSVVLVNKEPAGTLVLGEWVEGSNSQAVLGHESSLCLISDR